MFLLDRTLAPSLNTTHRSSLQSLQAAAVWTPLPQRLLQLPPKGRLCWARRPGFYFREVGPLMARLFNHPAKQIGQIHFDVEFHHVRQRVRLDVPEQRMRLAGRP